MNQEIVKVGQLQIRYLVDGSQGGGLGLFEMTVPAGARVPPPHSHTDNEECVYVLEGVLRYSVDDDTRDLGSGQWMSTPKGSVHHFSNPGSETARALVMMTPDIGEQYFHDVGAVVNTGGPPDLARLLEVMKQYGLVPAARQASRMAKGCAEDTGRVVALAALVLGAGVGMGTAAGVFDRLGAVELAVLSLFATLYALATYGLDRGVRQFILGQPLRRLAALAAAFDAALVATVCLALPWPPIGLFAGPLALVSNVALVERMLRAWRALPRPGAWSVSNPRMRVIPAAA